MKYFVHNPHLCSLFFFLIFVFAARLGPESPQSLRETGDLRAQGEAQNRLRAVGLRQRDSGAHEKNNLTLPHIMKNIYNIRLNEDIYALHTADKSIIE